MSDRKCSIGVTDVILLVLGALFVLGINTFFAPCGPKDDGGWMTCHWAGHAEAGIAVVISVIALIHLLVPNPATKRGLDLAVLPLTVLAAILPVNLISLCGMKTMRCHTVMHPAVIVVSIVIILVTICDILIQRKKK